MFFVNTLIAALVFFTGIWINLARDSWFRIRQIYPIWWGSERRKAKYYPFNYNDNTYRKTHGEAVFHRYRLQATGLLLFMRDSSLGAWIILDWNGMMEPFGKDFFFADAVHIGFFTRPEQLCSG